MSIAERYSCQVALPGFDAAAQQKLANAKVLVVGAGGLGCPALQYLVSTGVGTVGIADYDVVSEKNLHRQILYTSADVSMKKAEVAKERLQAQNPEVNIVVHDVKVGYNNVLRLLDSYDIVADCTDNFETRYLLNDAAVLSGKPLVYGAIYQYEGQAALWNIPTDDGKRSANYRDLYPDVNAAAIPNCAEGGVIPTIAGIVGCVQANEIIKYITGTGELLTSKLLVIDAQTMQSRVMKLAKHTRTRITSLPEEESVAEILFAEILQSPDEYLLIDVRTFEEREQYNIGGLHIPFNEISQASIDGTKPVVCYCASGKRSAAAANLLQKRFPELVIYSLAGGVNALF